MVCRYPWLSQPSPPRVHISFPIFPRCTHLLCRVPLLVNELLRILCRHHRERKFAADIDEPENLTHIDKGRATEVLERWIGLEKEGYDMIKTT